jgi:hypothetical protein
MAFGRTPFDRLMFGRHTKCIYRLVDCRPNDSVTEESTMHCVGKMSIGQMFIDQKACTQQVMTCTQKQIQEKERK